jgi:peptidoglycan/xylan/chitin deacetylase (PgdA/CDA1 family)
MTRLTLTFDNGPTPRITGRVLDLLGAHHAKAIFFVIGEKVRSPEGRALAERAVAEGHLVGNHTLTHTVPLGRLEAAGNIAAVEREIDEAQALLDGLTPDRLFRPYGAGGVIDDGLIGPHGRAHLAHRALTGVTWNCVPVDWLDPDGWVDRALAAIDEREHAVVVLHDVAGACLGRLDEFLGAATQRAVAWSQEFPADCLL